MIERAIENWLINTNEKNYQIPFCQVLNEILDLSTHGRLEFGKDIVSKDKEGIVHGYQLKTGSIDIPTWDKIYREVMDLVKTPCEHPNVNKKKPHISHLVSNGKISVDVLQRITKENDAGSNFSKLETIDKNQLLPLFVKAQGEFLPKTFDGFQEFLSFFQLKGNEFFPKKKFFMFIKTQILQIAKQKSNILNGIFASVILTSYILKNFQEKRNHFAQFEAWALLHSTLIGFIEKENQSDKKINETLKLINGTILENLDNLTEEFVSKDNLLEGSFVGDGDLVYRARATIVLGLVCCNKVYYNKDFNKDLHKKILENLKYVWFWGDSSFPYIFCIIKYLEKNKLQPESFAIINTILKGILTRNGFRSKEQAFANPYYNIEDTLGYIFCNKQLDYKQFKGSSHVLGPLIEIITRRDLTTLLEKNWRKISHLQISKFVNDNDWEVFYFWNEKGANYSNFLKQTQSWKELKENSKKRVHSDIFAKYIEFLPSFILAYPHRISEELVSCIDS